jgi:hypothetical protein
MAPTIAEFFGYPSTDRSQQARQAVGSEQCPFIGDRCEKQLHSGVAAGVCTLKQQRTDPVICCPIRLYAEDYKVLQDVADRAFGTGLPLEKGALAKATARRTQSPVVAVWGKRWGGELRLPQRSGSGSFFVDWILARLDAAGSLVDFVAIEVQTIDTTGNYQAARASLLSPVEQALVEATAGFNWENVNKRIIPQLLYKGNVLQRETKCTGGLFFVSPQRVFEKIMERVGGQSALLAYPLQSSSITFLPYNLGAQTTSGTPAPLVAGTPFTTNIQQLAQAFAGPGVMPPAGSYEDAIQQQLNS